jgi:hypothetical protein
VDAEIQDDIVKTGELIVRRELGALAEIEKARAVQEVQAALIIAKRFPRDELEAQNKIMIACKRYSLAESALYSFPRGGQKVVGESIRLAEVLAQKWGNIQYGFRELEHGDGQSLVEAFAWDQETNARQNRVFTVYHKIQLKNGSFKNLTDPRDIYEQMANQAQRRVRACILAIIPPDITEAAANECRRTLVSGKDKSEPLVDRIKRVVNFFAELGVSKELLEKKLGHQIDAMVPEEIADLQQIYNSMKDGQSKRSDWFEDRVEASEGGKAEKLNEKLKAKSEEKK